MLRKASRDFIQKPGWLIDAEIGQREIAGKSRMPEPNNMNTAKKFANTFSAFEESRES